METSPSTKTSERVLIVPLIVFEMTWFVYHIILLHMHLWV